MSTKYFSPFLFIICVTGFNYAVGQIIVKDTIKVNDEVCTYFALQPKEAIKGIVLLLPGKGEGARRVFKNTGLPNVLARKGYLTVIPDLHYSLFAGQTIKSQITEILAKQLLKYNLNQPNLLIGGFSAGGSVALSYSEFLLSSESATSLKGIFIIDSPIDLERLYASAERMLKYDCGDLIQQQGAATQNYLDNALGGSPTLIPKNYLALSPYSANSSDGGNARHLKNIPIRLYSEPDLQFVQKKYCDALRFEDINAFDLGRLYKFLLQIGNSKAEYITTTGKGFHSWNIADPNQLLDWIIKVSQ